MSGADNPNYGKVIISTSYVQGKGVSESRTYIESIEVSSILDALNVVAESLKDLKTSANHRVSFEIFADHKTLEPKRIEKSYLLERKN